MLNTKKIELEMTRAKTTKSKLCAKINIARSTLDSILNGGDARISTVEAIASALNVPLITFFDEDSSDSRQAGRDYIEGSGARITNGSETEVAALRELADERKERIEELKKRIKELEDER